MSDGPHRSLPRSWGWRRFAERIHIAAFSHDEERNALVTALEQDWRKGKMERLVRRVGETLRDRQTHFFCDQGAEQLKLLRREAALSPLQHAFLDFVDKATAGGYSGDGAIIEAANQTLSDLAAHRTRQVEEHCLRKLGQRRSTDFRQRIEGAINELDTAAPVHRLLRIDRNDPSLTLAKKTGLDDGVRLKWRMHQH